MLRATLGCVLNDHLEVIAVSRLVDVPVSKSPELLITLNLALQLG